MPAGVTAFGTGTANSSNQIVTSPFAVVAGQAILVWIVHGSAPTVTTVQDSLGLNYTLGRIIRNGGVVLELWYVTNYPVVGNQSITVTAILNSQASGLAMIAAAITATGTGTQTLLDNFGLGSTGTGTAITSNGTALQTGDTALMCVAFDSSGGAFSVGGGATFIAQVTNSQNVAGEYLTNVTGLQSMAGTAASTTAWCACVVMFYQSAASGGGGSSGGGSTTTPPPPQNQTSTPGNITSIPSIAGGTGLGVILNPNEPGSLSFVPIVNSRQVAQIGPINSRTSITCGIANAKLIQKKGLKGISPSNPNYAIPVPEPSGGFFSIVPVNGPDNINVALPTSGEYGTGFFLTDQNGLTRNLAGLRPSVLTQVLGASAPAATAPSQSGPGTTSSGAQSLVNEPLFNGTLHIVLVNFNNGNNNSISSADMATIAAYIKQCAPIQALYCAQWGTCGISIDSTIYTATMALASGSTTFRDADLAGSPGSPATPGFIDNLAKTLGFAVGGPTAHAFMIIAPPSVVNNDCNPANGYLGYHSASAVNNIPYIYVPLTTSGMTATDTGDNYQIPVSHEIAELIVDPAADLNNPEVCDSCGPNCQYVIRNFFDSTGTYIVSSQIFVAGQGPGFTYAFMTNAVSAPPYATTSGNTCPSLPYSSCAYAPPGTSGSPFNQFLPNFPPPSNPNLAPQITPSGIINLFFPNDLVIQGQLVNVPGSTMQVIKFPLNSPN